MVHYQTYGFVLAVMINKRLYNSKYFLNVQKKYKHRNLFISLLLHLLYQRVGSRRRSQSADALDIRIIVVLWAFLIKY